MGRRANSRIAGGVEGRNGKTFTPPSRAHRSNRIAKLIETDTVLSMGAQNTLRWRTTALSMKSAENRDLFPGALEMMIL